MVGGYSVKITGPNRAYPAQRTPHPQTEKTENTPRGEKTERVVVSELARDLAEARGPQEVDESRVERLRLALEDGSFERDAEQIAERMIQEESD